MIRSNFRTALAIRLLRATALALVAAPGITACGGSVVENGHPDGDSGGSGGEGGSTDVGGGQGGTQNVGGQGSAEGGAGGTTVVNSCFVGSATSVDECPPKEEAGPLLPGNVCGMPPYVVGDPTFENGACCYMVEPADSSTCGVGRPYMVDHLALAAAPARVRGWSDDATRPQLDGLSPEAREALARAWLGGALLEHASVASFGRFALELMAIGAPADLVDDAHRAALDEVRHARLCFSLASAYAGADLGPAQFPFAGSAEVRDDLAAIAASVVREGCIGETLAAAQAAAQLELATDPAVRAVLTQIAEDEARHAELAWRVVAWAIRIGGERVRVAVAAAFAAAGASASSAEPAAAIRPALLAHGRLEGEALRRAMDLARCEVLAPCTAALLRAA